MVIMTFLCEISSSYAMYYENLLRHQHQLLYMKEQVRQQAALIKVQSTFVPW